MQNNYFTEFSRACLVLAILQLTSSLSFAQNTGEIRVPVDGGKVILGTVERTVEAIGTLKSNESVALKPEIPGLVSMVIGEEGQFVSAGTILVQLEDRILNAEREQVLARHDLSKTNLARAEDLTKRGAGTDRALDEARAQFRLDVAALNLANARLDQTRIIAPFEGVLGLRGISVGDYLVPGQNVTNIEAINPLKVDFRVPEIYLSDVAEGQEIKLTVDAFPDEVFVGAVYAIDPVIDVNGRSIAVRATIPNRDKRLRPGLFARVDVLLERRTNAMLVPEETVVLSGDKKLVYTIVNGRVRVVSVSTGLRQGPNVEILSGLAPDDYVITAGQMKVREGSPVDLRVTATEG